MLFRYNGQGQIAIRFYDANNNLLGTETNGIAVMGTGTGNLLSTVQFAIPADAASLGVVGKRLTPSGDFHMLSIWLSQGRFLVDQHPPLLLATFGMTCVLSGAAFVLAMKGSSK